jgi:hypothetical protein
VRAELWTRRPPRCFIPSAQHEAKGRMSQGRRQA